MSHLNPHQTARPSHPTAKPSHPTAKPSHSAGKPRQKCPRPWELYRKPSRPIARPSHSAAKPSHPTAKPSGGSMGSVAKPCCCDSATVGTSWTSQARSESFMYVRTVVEVSDIHRSKSLQRLPTDFCCCSEAWHYAIGTDERDVANTPPPTPPLTGAGGSAPRRGATVGKGRGKRSVPLLRFHRRFSVFLCFCKPRRTLPQAPPPINCRVFNIV